MARPLKSGMDYFPHDTDASNDEKIESLMLAHGPAGYTFYFIALERIYRTDNGELNISVAETRQLLARKMFITIQEFELMLVTALKNGCFDESAYKEMGVLTSSGVKKRCEIVNRKRLINRDKKVIATETKQKQVNNPPETPESKVKKSKVKKSSIKVFVRPTLNEINDYCVQRNNKVDPQKFFSYYESNGWRVGKNPMKSWTAAVQTWEKNEFGGSNHARSQNGGSGGSTESPRAKRIRESREAADKLLGLCPRGSGIPADIHQGGNGTQGTGSLDKEIIESTAVEIKETG